MSPWIEWFDSSLKIAFPTLTVLSRIAIPMQTHVPLRELIQLAAGESDNGATETLLRIIGGPSVVQSYIHSLGINAFQLIDSEHDLDRDESLQFRDWIEPAAAVQLLQRLVHNPPLSPVSNGFLVNTLTASVTGPNRLRAGLPGGLFSHTRLAVPGLMGGSPPPPTT